MPKPTHATSIRLDVDLTEAMKRAAKDEERSVSVLHNRILRAWLTERGYLKPTAGARLFASVRNARAAIASGAIPTISTKEPTT